MSKGKITFYVDIISPFAYLGYWMLRHSPVFKSCEITYVPVLLGGIMKTTGNTAPLFIKNKDKWINKERLRWKTQFNVPMRDGMPPGFPFPTVTVQRLLSALEIESPSHLPVAIDTLYAAVWAPDSLAHPPSPKNTDYDMKNLEVLTALLSPAQVLGPELTKSIVSAVSSAQAKSQLTKNTDKAIERGAFGLPWFECTNSKGEVDGFWGFDHLGQVVRFMELQNVNDATKIQPML